MTEERTQYRIFLGSPGDLRAERELAETVVERINRDFGDIWNAHIKLDKWEDTPPAPDRAQGYINRVVDKCDIFVGMLYREWGTPTGEYSSGFEEEYEVCRQRHAKTGRPSLLMFFKRIEDDYALQHPSPGIRKVQKFKKSLIKNSWPKFAEFGADPVDFVGKLQSAIVEAIKTHIAESDSGLEAFSTQPPLDKPEAAEGKAVAPLAAGALLPPQVTTFVKSLMERSDQPQSRDQVDPVSIARFRLVGSVMGDARNDKLALGTHDANLIYDHVEPKELSYREHVGLLDAALSSYQHETSPLWRWYSLLPADTLLLSTVIDDRPARANAIRALTLIGGSLGSIEFYQADKVLADWFGAESTTAERLAALAYLGTFGTTKEEHVVRGELKRNSSETAGAALDALIRIMLRQSVQQAFDALLLQDPLTIADDLLESVLEDAAALPTSRLFDGLAARNPGIRWRCIRLLSERSVRDTAIASASLLADEDPRVRLEALLAITAATGDGVPVPVDARSQIVKTKSAWGLMGLGRNQKTEGEDEFREYSLRIRQRAADNALIADKSDEAFYVLASRHLSQYRHEVVGRIEASVAKVEADRAANSNQLFPDAKEEEEVRRLRLLLDILTSSGSKADLLVVRRVVDTKLLPFSAHDLRYFQRFGEWRDIGRVAEMASSRRSGGSGAIFGLWGGTQDHSTEVVPVLVRQGRGRLPELMEVLPKVLGAKVLAATSDKDFRALTDKDLLLLLQSSETSLRRACAIRCVRSLEKKRIEHLLAAYLEEASHFYNVVHWLDLGVSLSQSVARAAATRALQAH